MGAVRMITRTMNYQIIYKSGGGDFYEAQGELFNIQRATREIQNKTIQLLKLWDMQSYDNYKKTGEWLDARKEKGCSIDAWLYNELRENGEFMWAANYSTTIRIAQKKYKSVQKDVNTGKKSLPMYKEGQPINVRSDGLINAIRKENGEYVISCPLFSKKYSNDKSINMRFDFKVIAKDNSQKSIVNRVIEKKYKIGDCKIIYKNKKWFLQLAYSFEAKREKAELDEEKILGVDVGIVNAIYASSIGNRDRFIIPGGEIIEKAKRLEERRKALQKQSLFCGDGRIGHGTKTRVAPIFKQYGYLTNFRETVNHRYSKALVDFASKNGYGTIQMEDLTGIKGGKTYENDGEVKARHKMLENWSYYDLQQKIKYKAESAGINVKTISPKYTSIRCSRCGCIDKDNRKTQSVFKCVSCGYETNADFNASQNISIPNIDKVIEKQMQYNAVE